jgi:hypothetical protein
MFTRDRHELHRFKLPSPCFGRALLGLVVLASEAGCGSPSGSRQDGSVAASAGSGGATGLGAGGALPGSGGVGGSDGAIRAGVDGSAILADCAELPCLAPAANLIATCKPSYTCTSQYDSLSQSYCFDNGVSVLRSYGTGNTPSGHIIMSVKKDGAACYFLDVFYADAAANLAIAIYADAAGTEMISLYGAGASVTATCPGGSPVALPSSGQCATDANALAGLIPASSCISNTSGACQL